MDDSKTKKGVAAEAPAELAAVVFGIEPRVDNNKPKYFCHDLPSKNG